jgi:hypothetical protein
MNRDKKVSASYDPNKQFSDENWDRWTNEERLAWMINFRNQLKKKFAKKYGVSDEQMKQLDVDIEAMEKVVEYEKQVKVHLERKRAEDKMNRLGDEILGIMDSTKKRSLYIPPETPKDKKLN